jgi:uncharacterized membrane protein
MLTSVCLEIVLILMQSRCMVCTECTTGFEIVLDTPDGTPRWHGSCGIVLQSILEIVLLLVQERCTVCAKHTIGSEILLDPPKGTPR